MRRLTISVGRTVITVDLLDTPTADALWAAVPFESRAALWKGEVYFQTPVDVAREDTAVSLIQPGDIAFRPEGSAVILAWGPTPVSRGDEIRVASPSNLFARTGDDLSALHDVEPGDLILVERA